MERLKYDAEVYDGIVRHGRLVPLANINLRSLSNDDCERFCIADFEFESECGFNVSDITKIICVHAPLEANYRLEKCEGNVLTMKFYNIPVQGVRDCCDSFIN